MGQCCAMKESICRGPPVLGPGALNYFGPTRARRRGGCFFGVSSVTVAQRPPEFPMAPHFAKATLHQHSPTKKQDAFLPDRSVHYCNGTAACTKLTASRRISVAARPREHDRNSGHCRPKNSNDVTPKRPRVKGAGSKPPLPTRRPSC